MDTGSHSGAIRCIDSNKGSATVVIGPLDNAKRLFEKSISLNLSNDVLVRENEDRDWLIERLT
jgi:hypothetical protein